MIIDAWFEGQPGDARDLESIAIFENHGGKLRSSNASNDRRRELAFDFTNDDAAEAAMADLNKIGVRTMVDANCIELDAAEE